MSPEPPALTAADADSERGLWFDGLSSERQTVKLELDAADLVLVTDTLERRYPLSHLSVGEHWAGSPLPIGLPDGSSLWLGDAAQNLRGLLLQSQRARQRVARLTASWPAAVASAVLLVLLLFWFDRQGAGILGDFAVGLMPRSVDEAVGAQSLRIINGRWLTRSHVPEARRRALRERFAAVAASAAPDVAARVRFHRVISEKGTEAGFNAFALPDGTIIVLDGLCEALDDDALMAVLGHELGHVVHRHSIRSIARTLGLATVALAVLGDFSTVLANGVATVQTLAYDRDAEREADAYARAFISRAGLPPDTLLRVWRAFDQESRRRSVTGIPTWLSTHPSTEERMRQGGGP